MSLINQMLKDLESRQWAPDSAPLTMAAGIGASPRRSRWPRLLIATAALLLLGLITYLLWERYGAVTDSTVAKPHPASAAPTQQREAAPEQEAVTAAAPPTEVDRKVQPERRAVAVSGQRPSRVAAAIPPVTEEEGSATTAAEKPLEKRPPSRPDSSSVLPKSVTDEPSARFEKRTRPATPEELANNHYQEGYRLLSQGDRKGAEQEWLAALRVLPAHRESREGLAALYLDEGRRTEAKVLLAEGVKLLPDNATLVQLYARLLLEQGDSASAITTLEQYHDRGSAKPQPLAMLAALYQQHRRYPESIAAYQTALAQQNAQPAWWMGLAIAYEGVDDNNSAIEAYQRSQQLPGLSSASRKFVSERLQWLQND